MIQALDLQDEWIAEQVWRLQHAAYLIEVQFIGFSKMNFLQDTIVSLQNCGEAFYGKIIHDGLAGVISVKIKGNTVRICRLMVDPVFFRRGIARQLLIYVENLHSEAETIVVSTTSGNTPAIGLYESRGFRRRSIEETAHGVAMLEFCKRIRRMGRV